MDRQAEKQLIKERVRLDELVREVVRELKPRGPDDLWGCCPFHAEDTPSFHVRPALGFYKCFGCGEHGDVFTFVMKTRGLDFREALATLAERAGVTLGSLAPEERRRLEETRRIRGALQRARDTFHRALFERGGQMALQHLRERGFSDEILAAFDLGYIPEDFPRVLRQDGLGPELLDQAGFTVQFGHRIAFGIRDASGALVGFGARRLREDAPAKYVNTRETPAFSKGRILYGLDKAARSVARTRRLLIMEGYTDVMKAHQAGLTDAVAAMGTSLTDEHLRLILGRVSNLVLVFDGDEAGRNAADSAVRKAIVLGLESRVLVLPHDQDPCDWFLAGHGSEDFDHLLAERGVASAAFLCRAGLGRLDPGQPGAREAVAREVLELVRHVADPLRREALVVEVAREAGIDRLLLQRRPAASQPPESGRAPARRSPRPAAAPKARLRCELVAVAELGRRLEPLDTLRELRGAGVLCSEGPLHLLAIGEELVAEGAVVALDPLEWIERVRAQDPELAEIFEGVLLPPPHALLPTWEEAVDHLRAGQAAEQARQARRIALQQHDIANDGAALAALHDSLTSSARRRDAPS